MSELGPIGHLPVDHEHARNAAAGPRITIHKDGLQTFAPPPRQQFPPLEPTPENWRVRAACRGLDVNLFYAEAGGADAHDAKRVCAGCPVRQQCLDAALNQPERFGIWGGLGEHQRSRIRNPKYTAA